jgi:hypothetical protein
MSASVSEKPTAIAHMEDVENSLKETRTGAVRDYAGAIAKDDPLEIALVRKLDLRIMPILWCMYFMNYVGGMQPEKYYEKAVLIRFQLDRNAIANSRLNNLEKDLGLHGSQYNTCISILFVGYGLFCSHV